MTSAPPRKSKAPWLVLVFLALAAGGFWRTRQPNTYARWQGPTSDKILVEKKKRRLSLLKDGEVLASWHISLGRQPVGPKEREGDMKTPEGVYRVVSHNGRSAFHLALRLNYPKPEDIARAKAGGYEPGSDIMIHGLPNATGWARAAYVNRDWTFGCMALDNEGIERVYDAVEDGTEVEIRP